MNIKINSVVFETLMNLDAVIFEIGNQPTFAGRYVVVDDRNRRRLPTILKHCALRLSKRGNRIVPV